MATTRTCDCCGMEITAGEHTFGFNKEYRELGMKCICKDCHAGAMNIANKARRCSYDATVERVKAYFIKRKEERDTK